MYSYYCSYWLLLHTPDLENLCVHVCVCMAFDHSPSKLALKLQLVDYPQCRHGCVVKTSEDWYTRCKQSIVLISSWLAIHPCYTIPTSK